MGTSGAYGGSGKQGWRDARRRLEQLIEGDGGGGNGDAQDREPNVEHGPADGDRRPEPGRPAEADPYGPLASTIANALISDDPDLRPRTPRVYPLPSLLPSRRRAEGGGGGGAGGVRSGSNAGSGRPAATGRGISRSAQRGGAALAAAYAYRQRDRAALETLNLDLDELDRVGPRERAQRILAAVLGDANVPDSDAIRRAVGEQLRQILGENPPSPLESIRAMIASYVFQMGIEELRAGRRAGLNRDEVLAAERGLRNYLERRVRTVGANLGDAIPIAAMQAAAAQILREGLRLVRASTARGTA